MNLQEKVALVTGSSQGIGQTIAVHLVQAGADIVIDYRSHPNGAKEALAKVKAAGRKGHIVQADLSSVSDIRKLVLEGVQHFGKLDILVNNAGIDGKNADFWNITEADYDAVLNTNLKGTFFTTQAFVQHLIETKRTGKIINISSTHEEMAFPHFTSYCVSKGGVKMMMKSMAQKLAPQKIRINSIAPGAIKTQIDTVAWSTAEAKAKLLQLIPAGRVGIPDDIGKAVVWLASDDSDYINGTTLFVDGGMTLYPGFAKGD